MSGDTLTAGDVFNLHTILDAAARGARVRWLADGNDVDILDGVARCIAHDGGGLLRADEDVRDGFLHVSGMGEHWLPVRQIMAKVSVGTFAVDERP
jgi:hypothetical protein